MKKMMAYFFTVIAIIPAICFSFQSSSLKIGDKDFMLKFSNCKSDKPVCMNEYYLSNEFDNQWTELFTVVYAKDIVNPHEYADALKSKYRHSNLIAQTNDYDIISFLIPYKQNDKLFIEQNVSKITKARDKKGTVSLQIAKRYEFNQKRQDSLQKEMFENMKKSADTLSKLQTPDIYLNELQKW